MGFARVINFKLTPLLPEPEPWPAHSYERAAATDRSCAQLYAKIRRHANSSDSWRRRACARLSATARCFLGQAFALVSGAVGSALMVRARKLTEPLLCDISRVSEILLSFVSVYSLILLGRQSALRGPSLVFGSRLAHAGILVFKNNLISAGLQTENSDPAPHLSILAAFGPDNYGEGMICSLNLRFGLRVRFGTWGLVRGLKWSTGGREPHFCGL